MTLFSKTQKYDDIINLPHHVSTVHPPMDIMDRAAQFSPFAALSGYEAATKETQRLTEPKIELDESEKELLDVKFRELSQQLDARPEVTITYFVPDRKKEGGVYRTVTGRVYKINSYKRLLYLETKEEIPLDDILSLQL